MKTKWIIDTGTEPVMEANAQLVVDEDNDLALIINGVMIFFIPTDDDRPGYGKIIRKKLPESERGKLPMLSFFENQIQIGY